MDISILHRLMNSGAVKYDCDRALVSCSTNRLVTDFIAEDYSFVGHAECTIDGDDNILDLFKGGDKIGIADLELFVRSIQVLSGLLKFGTFSDEHNNRILTIGDDETVIRHYLIPSAQLPMVPSIDQSVFETAPVTISIDKKFIGRLAKLNTAMRGVTYLYIGGDGTDLVFSISENVGNNIGASIRYDCGVDVSHFIVQKFKIARFKRILTMNRGFDDVLIHFHNPDLIVVEFKSDDIFVKYQMVPDD